MPSQTNTTTAAAPAASSSTAARKRFELPALDFKFGSLTDGTDIPPPLPSPIQEETGLTPPDTPDLATTTNGKPTTSNTSPSSQLSGTSTTAGVKRRAEDSPASPTLSSRPGSIRRLFSRNLLNSAYTNGEGPAPTAAGTMSHQDVKRPQSRGGSSVAGSSRRAKRASGWFGRLLTNEAVVNNNNSSSSRAATPAPLSPPPPSTSAEEKKKVVPAGPPPPMIPELSELNSKLGLQSDSGFGSDLFKDIK